MSKTVKAAVKPQDSRMVLIIEPKTESRAPSQYALISYNNATAVDVVSNPSGTGATSQTTINETIKNSQEFVAESVKMKLSKDQKHKKIKVSTFPSEIGREAVFYGQKKTSTASKRKYKRGLHEIRVKNIKLFN